jgi:mRNA interferase RelE/StbE
VAKYSIEFKKSVSKDLKGIPSKDVRAILEKVALLADNPRPNGSIKLSGDEKYRIRHGDFRILYEIFDEVVIIVVVKIGHRRDVYR